MGVNISFTTLLDTDQLNQVAGPGIADRVTSTDQYDPHVLRAVESLDAAARKAIEARWAESYPLSVYATRFGEKFRVEFATRVSNTSDRSTATLEAKLDTIAETIKVALGAPRLLMLSLSH